MQPYTDGAHAFGNQRPRDERRRSTKQRCIKTHNSSDHPACGSPVENKKKSRVTNIERGRWRMFMFQVMF